jgi:hypothetical protein
MGDPSTLHFRKVASSMRPGEVAIVRFSFRARCSMAGSVVAWDEMPLRVQVGWFTRTEVVGLSDMAMAFTGTKASAACHP